MTFFFNSLRNEPFAGEDRILIDSPKVATYDLQPEMSAEQVTEALLKAIESEQYDVIITNFANCDMVGHTGVYDAIIKAVFPALSVRFGFAPRSRRSCTSSFTFWGVGFFCMANMDVVSKTVLRTGLS